MSDRAKDYQRPIGGPAASSHGSTTAAMPRFAASLTRSELRFRSRRCRGESLVMVRVFVFAFVSLCVACTTTANPRSCLDNHCSDPALPFCDETGAISGTPGTCVAVTCEAGVFEECRDDAALVCNDEGTSFDMVQCPYGCGEFGCLPCNTADCETRLIPKFAPDICSELTANEAVVYDADVEIDTSDAANCDEIVPQSAGPEICVVRAPTIRLAAQRVVKVRGTRAIAFVSDRELDIDGTLDVSADRTTNGPAGGFTKSGTSAGMAGGGAGYRTPGGSGGSDAGAGGSANGGPAGSSPLLVTTLFGGTQATAASTAEPPGGAGGAAMFVSCRGEVSVSGLVDAGGGGGGGDYLYTTPPPIMVIVVRASGGGSGGTIVIQGMAVRILGELYANGGGGGGGGQPGNPGTDGQRSTTPAPGGPDNTVTGGDGTGGNGGAIASPTVGLGDNGSFGAGGASAGYIVVFAPSGASTQLTPRTVSPAIDSSTVPTN
jgi:hypothetical protein